MSPEDWRRLAELVAQAQIAPNGGYHPGPDGRLYPLHDGDPDAIMSRLAGLLREEAEKQEKASSPVTCPQCGRVVHVTPLQMASVVEQVGKARRMVKFVCSQCEVKP